MVKARGAGGQPQRDTSQWQQTHPRKATKTITFAIGQPPGMNNRPLTPHQDNNHDTQYHSPGKVPEDLTRSLMGATRKNVHINKTENVTYVVAASACPVEQENISNYILSNIFNLIFRILTYITVL